MGQTVVGFFKDVLDVQKAVRSLESNGISNQQVDISKGRHPDEASDSNNRNTNKITNFFNKLFGHDSDDARLYSTIAQQDVHILTVHLNSGDLAERAAEIMDDCGAIDVDEHRSISLERNPIPSNLQRDRSRSSTGTIPGIDKSLSYRDDYANTLSTEFPSRDINEPTNPYDDSIDGPGPGMHNPNSKYVDERAYPGSDTDTSMHNPIEDGNRNRALGDMGAGTNDDFSRSGERQAGLNNESGMRGQGGAFTGQDMTNDGISSPDDDQRTIDQNNPAHERRNMISNEEAPGLETRIPTPLEQLERAKRRSRIVNASVGAEYRLRD